MALDLMQQNFVIEALLLDFDLYFEKRWEKSSLSLSFPMPKNYAIALNSNRWDSSALFSLWNWGGTTEKIVIQGKSRLSIKWNITIYQKLNYNKLLLLRLVV